MEWEEITNLADLGKGTRFCRDSGIHRYLRRGADLRSQMEKAKLFRALHERPGAFIIPNPWDAGTARLLASLGFEALATTSLGLANTLGSATVSRDTILENCRIIAGATDLKLLSTSIRT